MISLRTIMMTTTMTRRRLKAELESIRYFLCGWDKRMRNATRMGINIYKLCIWQTIRINMYSVYFLLVNFTLSVGNLVFIYIHNYMIRQLWGGVGSGGVLVDGGCGSWPIPFVFESFILAMISMSIGFESEYGLLLLLLQFCCCNKR